MQLYPRLPLPRAQALGARFQGLPCEELRVLARPTLEGARFAPTGGHRISLRELLVFRTRLDEIAREAGWPDDSLAGRQHFDRTVAVWLGGLSLPPGEALRAETWSWFAVQLVPHLVRWRFRGGAAGETGIERFAGPIQRNALGRLWLRGWVLDQGAGNPERWSLAQTISEDAAVAILERTTLASQHRIARTIAGCWLAAKSAHVLDHEGLLREAIKRVRVLAVLRDLTVLDDEVLATTIRALFEAALAARGQGVVSVLSQADGIRSDGAS